MITFFYLATPNKIETKRPSVARLEKLDEARKRKVTGVHVKAISRNSYK